MNTQNSAPTNDSSNEQDQDTNIRPNSKILFKNALFQFYPLESGTAALFASSPFGGTEPLLDRIAHLVGQEPPQTKEEIEAIIEIYHDFYQDFPLIVSSFPLNPGSYEVVDTTKATEIIFGSLQEGNIESEKAPDEKAEAALENSFEDYKTTIEVTPTHLAMLKATLWQIEDQFNPIRNDEENYLKETIPSIHEEVKKPENQGIFFNYPIVAGDGKRPYGDRTYYYWDLEDLNIPGIKADGTMDESGRQLFSEESTRKIDSMQQELYLVLQAMAQQMQ